MGVTPGFVCMYFGARSRDRTDRIVSPWDQTTVPFPPAPEVPPVRTGTASCDEGGHPPQSPQLCPVHAFPQVT